MNGNEYDNKYKLTNTEIGQGQFGTIFLATGIQDSTLK